MFLKGTNFTVPVHVREKLKNVSFSKSIPINSICSLWDCYTTVATGNIIGNFKLISEDRIDNICICNNSLYFSWFFIFQFFSFSFFNSFSRNLSVFLCEPKSFCFSFQFNFQEFLCESKSFSFSLWTERLSVRWLKSFLKSFSFSLWTGMILIFQFSFFNSFFRNLSGNL